MKAKLPPVRRRPMPPEDLGEAVDFAPAPEVLAWAKEQILAEEGPIHNPDHAHLLEADLRVLWAACGFQRQGRFIVGQAEEMVLRGNQWQKGRQEQQLRQWFGTVPDFLITLDASYCRECGDAEFCALVEHELYHIAHKRDAFGAPAFTQSGLPKLAIQGHDVEEFVGVVKRYGAGNPEGAVARLARAAAAPPEVSRVSIAGACGTCLMRVA